MFTLHDWPLRLPLLLVLLSGACGNEGSGLDARVAREAIPVEKLGVQNEFFPTAKVSSEAEQWRDISENLGLEHVRATFFFDESYMPFDGAPPSFERFDGIVGTIPPGADLLPILAYAPSWLAGREDWKDVFLDRYVIPVVARYGADPRIAGWQIWNEPDAFCDGGRSTPAGVLDCSAADYVDLVRRVEPVIRALSSAPIVGAATTSIPQSFPLNLDFNQRMIDAGLLDLVDVYAVHWYGTTFDRLELGIARLLGSTGKPVWVTETGEQGAGNQLGYAADAFPAFERRIPGLERIYVFTYFEGFGVPASETFGLVAGDGSESDLYTFLEETGP